MPARVHATSMEAHKRGGAHAHTQLPLVVAGAVVVAPLQKSAEAAVAEGAGSSLVNHKTYCTVFGIFTAHAFRLS